MTKVSGNSRQNTKKLRFTLLAAFFNYIKNSSDQPLRILVIIERFEDFSGPEKISSSKLLKKIWLMKLFSEHRIKVLDSTRFILKTCYRLHGYLY